MRPGKVPLLVPSCLPLSRARWGCGIISLMGQHSEHWLLDSCPCLPKRIVLTEISPSPSLPSSQPQVCISFPSLCTHSKKLPALPLPDCPLAWLALWLSVELPGSQEVWKTEAQSPKLDSGGRAMSLRPWPFSLSLPPTFPFRPLLNSLPLLLLLDSCKVEGRVCFFSDFDPQRHPGSRKEPSSLSGAGRCGLQCGL